MLADRLVMSETLRLGWAVLVEECSFGIVEAELPAVEELAAVLVSEELAGRVLVGAALAVEPALLLVDSHQ